MRDKHGRFVEGYYSATNGFKKGQHISYSTEIKKHQHLSPKTEFKKGLIPPFKLRPPTEKERLNMSIAHRGKPAWNKGKRGLQIAWNRGLTKETDMRVAKYSQSRPFRKIPFHDTKPELIVQAALRELGVQFRTHAPITGQPDIFIEPNICIFVDGCYWHKC